MGLSMKTMWCMFVDPNMMCSSDQEFFSDGFCYGVVDGEDDDACDDIFIPGSHPVYIKTESIQVILRCNCIYLSAESSFWRVLTFTGRSMSNFTPVGRELRNMIEGDRAACRPLCQLPVNVIVIP